MNVIFSNVFSYVFLSWGIESFELTGLPHFRCVLNLLVNCSLKASIQNEVFTTFVAFFAMHLIIDLQVLAKE